MRKSYHNIAILIGFCFFTLSACGGGGSSNPANFSAPPPPTNAGGVWEGSTFNNNAGLTFQTVGVVTENNGEGRFVNDQGVQFILSGISGTNGNFSATITAIAPFGTVFIDGSSVTSGTITGTVVERTSLQGDWTLNTGETGTMTMSYDSIYERGSNLSRTTGMWIDSFGVVYTIEANGDFFAQDAFGCVFDGNVSILDASFNAYGLTMTVSICPSVNGNYSGLGVLGDDVGMDDAFVVQMDSNNFIFTDVLLKL